MTGSGLHSWATMRRAAKKLGVISRKRPQADGRGPWEWVLPEVAADTAATEPTLGAMAPAGYQARAERSPRGFAVKTPTCSTVLLTFPIEHLGQDGLSHRVAHGIREVPLSHRVAH